MAKRIRRTCWVNEATARGLFLLIAEKVLQIFFLFLINYYQKFVILDFLTNFFEKVEKIKAIITFVFVHAITQKVLLLFR